MVLLQLILPTTNHTSITFGRFLMASILPNLVPKPTSADICEAGLDFVHSLGEHIDNLVTQTLLPRAVNGSLLQPIGKLPEVRFHLQCDSHMMSTYVPQSWVQSYPGQLLCFSTPCAYSRQTNLLSLDKSTHMWIQPEFTLGPVSPQSVQTTLSAQ